MPSCFAGLYKHKNRISVFSNSVLRAALAVLGPFPALYRCRSGPGEIDTASRNFAENRFFAVAPAIASVIKCANAVAESVTILTAPVYRLILLMAGKLHQILSPEKLV